MEVVESEHVDPGLLHATFTVLLTPGGLGSHAAVTHIRGGHERGFWKLTAARKGFTEEHWSVCRWGEMHDLVFEVIHDGRRGLTGEKKR